MKFKLLTIFLTTISISRGVFAIEILPTTTETTYEWSTTCYDCRSAINIIAPQDQWSTVSGTLTLANYTLGEEFNRDNFREFTYDSDQSDHLFADLIFSNLDDLSSANGRLFTDGSMDLHIEHATVPQITIEEIPEYTITTTANTYTNISMQSQPESPLPQNKIFIGFNILVSNRIDVDKDLIKPSFFDIGASPQITMTASIPEPASLTLLSLGLIGLALRRFQKQA